MRQPALLACDADELFDVRIPGCEVGVSDRPIHPMAVLHVRLEIEIAPPPAGASPNQTAAAELISANPAKGLPIVGVIGMLAILDEEVLCCLSERVVLALDRVVARVDLGLALATMRKLPRLRPLRDVVLSVLDVSTALDQQCTQAVLGQLLRRPATGDSRADDDCVERLRTPWRHVRHTAGARPRRIIGTHPSKWPGTGT